MKLRILLIGIVALYCASVAVAQDAAARTRYAETLREETVKKSAMPPGFNISAEGPDATFCIVHRPAITFPMCNKLATNPVFISKLEELGFKYFVCTDDGNAKFTFDVAEVSSQLQTKPLSNDDLIQMVSILQATLTKGFPNMQVRTLGNIIIFADPKFFETQAVRTAFHELLQTIGAEATLCKYGFKKLRFESPEVTSGAIGEDDLRCTGTEEAARGRPELSSGPAPRTAAPQQEKGKRASATISGKVFAITKGGDLKPARLASVYLIYHHSETDSQAFANGQLTTAGTVFDKWRCPPLIVNKGKKTESTVTFCNPSYALMVAAYWASGQPAQNSPLCCFKEGMAPVQGKNAPEQIQEATADEEGVFTITTNVPGHYLLVVEGRAGMNQAIWLENVNVELGKQYMLKMSTTISAELDTN